MKAFSAGRSGCRAACTTFSLWLLTTLGPVITVGVCAWLPSEITCQSNSVVSSVTSFSSCVLQAADVMTVLTAQFVYDVGETAPDSSKPTQVLTQRSKAGKKSNIFALNALLVALFWPKSRGCCLAPAADCQTSRECFSFTLLCTWSGQSGRCLQLWAEAVLGRILFRGRALSCSWRINPGKPSVCRAINLCGVWRCQRAHIRTFRPQVHNNSRDVQCCQVDLVWGDGFLASYVRVFSNSVPS